jgi:hypothetical protein
MSIWEAIGQSDEWYTPAYIFDALGVRFDLDVAAPYGGGPHVPAREWFAQHGLERDWHGFIWMNPPFGGRNGLEPWLRKFIAHGNGIALVPDRTSAPWFQTYCTQADAVLFVAPKIKFERPDGSIGKQPGTGTALLARGPMGVQALLKAHGKIGATFTPRRAA